MPGRHWGAGYRFGFNGQEKDDDIKGMDNSIEFKFRIYDNRLARFLSVDPIAPKYPSVAPYAFAENKPIAGRDLEGREFEWFESHLIAQSMGVTVLQEITTNHNGKSAELVKASYNVQVQTTAESFQKLQNVYTHDPGIVHNPGNDVAQYTPMKAKGANSTIDDGDHMKIVISAGYGAVNMDIYVRFKRVEVSGTSFSITAATLYGHTDAGTINFSGNFDPKTGIASFTIHNETVPNVELDNLFLGGLYGRYKQEQQWKLVLKNVENLLSGKTVSKTLDKEISIAQPEKGDVIQQVHEDLITGEKSGQTVPSP